MNTVLVITTLAIFAVMAMALIRALKGPSVYDRILAVNMFGTKTVLVVALITYLNGHAELIDVALVYALINFIAVITILKLAKTNDLAGAATEDRADD